MEEHKQKCGCGDEDCKDDFNMEDVVYDNNFAINGILALLIDKKVFTKEEFDKKLEEIEKSMQEE
ncbi:MAG: hypothetical protein KKF44_06775 [Nanoarchaeota archaeon]|nr:hypothetical protein [Nanoarchaeota archaeon]